MPHTRGKIKRNVLIDMVNGTEKAMHNIHCNVSNTPPYKTKYIGLFQKLKETLIILTSRVH